jgi:hypothetical protein
VVRTEEWREADGKEWVNSMFVNARSKHARVGLRRLLDQVYTQSIRFDLVIKGLRKDRRGLRENKLIFPSFAFNPSVISGQ